MRMITLKICRKYKKTIYKWKKASKKKRYSSPISIQRVERVKMQSNKSFNVLIVLIVSLTIL